MTPVDARRGALGWSAVGLICGLVYAGVGCSGAHSGGSKAGANNGGGGFGNSNGSSGASAGGGSTSTRTPVHTSYTCDGCKAFPGSKTAACSASQLAPPEIAYPTDGILFPPNLNVIEVQFTPPSGATLFEVDFMNSVTDVRVETQCAAVANVRGGSQGCGVTLSQTQWNDIANVNRDGDPVQVTVRATDDAQGCTAKSETKVNILFAKEDLRGGIYYWQSGTFGGVAGTTGGIYVHDFGTFDATPTPFYTSDATGRCVGCHNLSHDGERVSLGIDDPDADDEFGDVHTQVLEVATQNVLTAKGLSPGFQTFTHDHQQLLTTTWTKKGMSDTSFQVFGGDGTPMITTLKLPDGIAGTHIDLSRDDQTLVYAVPQAGSISTAGDHHFMAASIFTSSYDPGAHSLGAPTAVLMASGTQSFYYPSFAPDESFLVFNEAPDGDAFYNRNARVKLLEYPATQPATAIDLPDLNVADGLSNSWPKWSPFVQTYKGHKLLWVTFSSNRDYGLHLSNKGFDSCYPPESPDYDQPQPSSKKDVMFTNCAQPQIWMAAIVVDKGTFKNEGEFVLKTPGTGDRSFPAFWLPFQDVTSHNHTAQWVDQVTGTPPPTTPPNGGMPQPGPAPF
jgi:hypothetical protein